MTQLTLIDAFERIPPLMAFKPQDFQIQPLAGLTNCNFHLKNDSQDWVLRIPRAPTNDYIDRRQEAANAEIAAQLAIAPPCVWQDETGLSLTATIRHSRPIEIGDFNNEQILTRLLAILGRLHRSDKPFIGRVDPGELISRYYRLIPGATRLPLDSHYRDALAINSRLRKADSARVCSHNDLVLENILIDDAARLWLIDWEYAAMTSPYWDLASLCNAAGLDQAQCERLLKLYGADLDAESLNAYRYLLALLSTCWMTAFAEVDMDAELETLEKLR